MSRTDGPRRDSRHRAAFLAQVPGRLGTLAALLEDTTEPSDMLAFELSRLAETAERLGLDAVAAASGAKAAGPPWRERLRAVSRAVAAAPESTPFRPIAIVSHGWGGTFDEILCADRLCVFETTSELLAGMVAELPQVAIVPAADSEGIRALVAADVTVFATGDGWDARVQALAAGATAWLPAGELSAGLAAVRWATWVAGEPPVAALVNGDGRWTSALEESGFAVVTYGDARELADTWAPDALVVVGSGAALRGEPSVIAVLRAHPKLSRLVVAAQAMDADVPLSGSAARVSAALAKAVERVRRMQSYRDPITGLSNRVGALRSLDRRLASAARTHERVSAVVLSLDGMEVARGRDGVAAQVDALRLAARAMRKALRRFDVVGRVGGDVLLAGLPGCGEDEAARRLHEIAAALQAELKRDPRLDEIVPLVGVADTAPGPARLLERAWASLAHARQGA